MKQKLIRYSVTAGIAALVFLLVAFIEKLFWLTSRTEVMKVLCDCFAVPGIILLLFGLLVICSNGGTFDMLGFGMKKFFGLFKKESDKQSFYEYRVKKQESRRSFAYLLIVGAAYTALGVLFLILYYKV